MPAIRVLTAPAWQDYELLDSGGGLKLERFGPYRLVRPEAEAVWQPSLSADVWDAAHAVYQSSGEESGGRWLVRSPMETRWPMAYKHLKFYAQTSSSRHLGVFPEQAAHWDWIHELIQSAHRSVRVLNLFGYTGLASLAAASAGAHVTHVDASRKAITWARENQIFSGLGERPVRYILDDALKFVAREVRRGASYDGLILDPPKFGRGPKGEVWEFYRLLPQLLEECRMLLSPQPLFIVLTAYAVKASAVTLYQAIAEMTSGAGGLIEAGELALVEHGAGRMISTAVYARWSAEQPARGK